MRCTIVIEAADSNYPAYVPDLPGCVATGNSIENVECAIREAIELHLENCARTIVRFPPRTAGSTTSRLQPDAGSAKRQQTACSQHDIG